MFKFIKDEIELITVLGANEKSMLIPFLIVFGLTTYMIISIYKTSLGLISTALIKTEMLYSFSSESICPAPPTPEFMLLLMLGCFVALTIIIYDNHRLDEKYKTSK